LYYKRVEKTQIKVVISPILVLLPIFSRITNLVNIVKVYGEDILAHKALEKFLGTMLMKFDYPVTTIIKFYDTKTIIVTDLQESIENRVNKILEMTEKVDEERLNSQGNLNIIAKCRRKKL